jgi:hypothetical protein
MNDFDYVLGTIDPWIGKYLEHGYEELSAQELVGVGVWLLEVEVNNGGFDQYYFNSADELALPTVGALKTIGAERTANLLSMANSKFPNSSPPVHRTMRQEQLHEIRDVAKFSALDDEFFQAQDDLTSLLAST